MASKSTNKTGTSRSGSSKSSTPKRSSTSSASSGTRKRSNSNRKSSSVLRYELKLLALIGFTILSGFSIHSHAAGMIGTWIRECYLGLFSAAGYLGPYFLFIIVFFCINPNLKPIRRRYLFASMVLFLSIVLLVSSFNYDTFMAALKGRGLTLYQFNGMTYGYAEGILLRGGGLLGNLIGGSLIGFTGLVGSYLIALVMLAVSLMAGTDLTLEKIFKDTKTVAGTAAGKTKEKIGEMDAAYKARREEALLYEDDILAEEDIRDSQPQDINRGASWFAGRFFKSKNMTDYDSDNFIPPDTLLDKTPLVEKDRDKGYDMYEDEAVSTGGAEPAPVLQTTTETIATGESEPAVNQKPYPFEVGETPTRTLVAAGKITPETLTDSEISLVADAVLASKMAATAAIMPRDIAFSGAIFDSDVLGPVATETDMQKETVTPDDGQSDWRAKLSDMKAWSAARQSGETDPSESPEECSVMDADAVSELGELDKTDELDDGDELENLDIAIVEASVDPLEDLVLEESAPRKLPEDLPDPALLAASTATAGALAKANRVVPSTGAPKPFTGKQLELEELDEVELEYEISQNEIKAKKAEYILPSFDLLDEAKPQKGTDKKELFHKAQVLEDTLKSFGVEAKVNQITRGPSITMFELQPSPGVKVSKIVGLSDDIALGLAASQVRIIAPIPGKSAVGVEIPNDDTTLVSIREVLESDNFDSAESKLSFVLGKDIQGASIVGDLAKMPHLLIAGSTGSGKSVCVNTFIASILFNATPDEVKFLMIDPKVVELSIYNGIPHLLLPVVTDPKKASVALNWAVQEMTRRYKLFADSSVRDVNSYNAKVQGTEEEKLPKIVLIIDELADLMMVAPNQIEDSICRLAQMARAAGIHLLVATQRPSVDVITGLIKANIPSRIAFAVSSMTDSRTILDMGGAEKLLGKGDMLYYPVGMNKPQRIQGAFVSDAEVSRIVEYCSTQDHQPEYNTEILETSATAESNSEADELLPGAIEIAVKNGQASASMLQRKFRIGYNRAARIVDQMEERGVIGPSLGSKPREVLMSEAEWEELDFS